MASGHTSAGFRKRCMKEMYPSVSAVPTRAFSGAEMTSIAVAFVQRARTPPNSAAPPTWIAERPASADRIPVSRDVSPTESVEVFALKGHKQPSSAASQAPTVEASASQAQIPVASDANKTWTAAVSVSVAVRQASRAVKTTHNAWAGTARSANACLGYAPKESVKQESVVRGNARWPMKSSQMASKTVVSRAGLLQRSQAVETRTRLARHHRMLEDS